jgi:hypothetical protein
VAYDSKLAERVRTVTGSRRGVTERQMFGGLAFLLGGKMFCGVLGDELLARVGPAAHAAALARPHVRVMDFTGKPMTGYVFVGPRALGGAALRRWVDACAEHVATLPARAPSGRGARTAARTARPAARARRPGR